MIWYLLVSSTMASWKHHYLVRSFFHFNAHFQGIVHILGRHSHIFPMFSRRVKFQVPAGGEEQDDRVQELGDE